MLWDRGLVDATDDVEVTLPSGSRAGRVPGVRVTRRALSDEESTRRRGIPVTGPLRTAPDLARSPQETRVRLLLHRSSLPDPVAQFRVIVGGRHLARVDFAWPEHRLALEYDGVWHAEPGQFRRDRERLDRPTAAGRRVIFVTAADLRSPEAPISRIAQALAAPRFP